MLVAITGYGQGAADHEDAAAAGFDHYFVKPVDAEELLGALGGVTKR